MRKAPERIETARLILRKPARGDAEEMFSRYASDPEVTRYVGWPMHRSIEATRAFLSFSDAEWIRWPAGPFLIESMADKRLLGSTGLGFETNQLAATGYVLSRDAWGCGYATEALSAMVALAGQLGVVRLCALCHPQHRASARVLEKCGFTRETGTERRIEFPNLATGEPEECLCYCLPIRKNAI